MPGRTPCPTSATRALFLHPRWTYSRHPGGLHEAATRGHQCTLPATHTEHLEKLSAWLEGPQFRNKLCRQVFLVWGGESKPQDCWVSPAVKAHFSFFSGMGLNLRLHKEVSLLLCEWGCQRLEGAGGTALPSSSGYAHHACCPPWTTHPLGNKACLSSRWSGGNQRQDGPNV